MITVRFCYEDTPEFWLRWKEELADIVTEISLARPDCGGYIANCPFHGAIGHHYTNMEVVSIYTVSTHYLHTIYTVSTQYLHTIYTLSTQVREDNRGSVQVDGGPLVPGITQVGRMPVVFVPKK